MHTHGYFSDNVDKKWLLMNLHVHCIVNIKPKIFKKLLQYNIGLAINNKIFTFPTAARDTRVGQSF